MQIAVIGGGFAGLALAWHFLRIKKSISLTLFEQNEIGSGASGVSAGLLHYYAGLKAKKNFLGEEGYESTRQLLDAASEFSSAPIYENSGLLRFPINENQEKCFIAAARDYPDVHWLSAEECLRMNPGVFPSPGLFIENCLTVYPDKYMAALWKGCESLGARHKKRKIHNFNELEEFDLIIGAAGAGILAPPFPSLPINALKGQILELPWPENIPMPKSALSSEIYVVPDRENKKCFVGSTFEREFTNADPDPEEAEKKLLPHLIKLYPAFSDIKPTGCRAGIRVTSRDRFPFIQQIEQRIFVFTGLGSKGLLYHSLLAENFVKTIA